MCVVSAFLHILYNQFLASLKLFITKLLPIRLFALMLVIYTFFIYYNKINKVKYLVIHIYTLVFVNGI